MAQRLFNLAKWTLMRHGQSIYFDNAKPREVKIDVNCPEERAFYVAQDLADMEANPEKVEDHRAGREVEIMGDPKSADAPVAGKGRAVTFLGLARGRDRFEFTVDGAFELMAVGGECYVFSADSQRIEARNETPEIFTRLANRRQRNPHMEMMQFQVRRNMERFALQVQTEADRRMQALERKLESYAPQRDIRAPAALIGGAPEPVDGDAGTSHGEGGADASKEPVGGGKAKAGKAAAAADNAGAKAKVD